MEAYLQVFINFEQKNWPKFLLMAEFVYNNVTNASTGHKPFKLNYGYNPWVFFEKYINFCSQSKIADELLAELQKLITICRENHYYVSKL